jgi:DNA-binding IclR family transcriptional regulator
MPLQRKAPAEAAHTASEEASAADADASASTSLVSLAILEVLADAEEEMGVTHLAAGLGIPKARVHRHLTALRNEGYVTQSDKTSRYRIGWRLFLLGQKLVRNLNVVTLAKPVMQELRDLVGHTIVITTSNEQRVVVMDLVRGRTPLEIFLKPGTEYMLHASAQGKVMLAYGDPQNTDNALGRPLESCTPRTVVDAAKLREELVEIRQKGWAEAPEELFMGVNALAAPLFHSGGQLFGALAIVGSIHFLPAPARPDTVGHLLAAAARISKAFGASLPPGVGWSGSPSSA